MDAEKRDAVTSIRVRYAECDPMQVAHHSTYLIWFEAGRADLCRLRGIDYTAMERSGLFLPVVEARCRYVASAHYDELLVLTTTIVEIKRRTVRFGYRLVREAQLVAEGETYQMLVDANGRPTAFPADLYDRFQP